MPGISCDNGLLVALAQLYQDHSRTDSYESEPNVTDAITGSTLPVPALHRTADATHQIVNPLLNHQEKYRQTLLAQAGTEHRASTHRALLLLGLESPILYPHGAHPYQQLQSVVFPTQNIAQPQGYSESDS